jgi:DNA-binding transcriptional ArsR family regulator
MSMKHGLTPALLERVAEQFKALSEPSRLALMSSLFQGERTVGELAELSGLSLANVSKHLWLLHQAGFVTRRRQGLSVVYALADKSTLELCELMCSRVRERAQAMALSLSAPPRDGRKATRSSLRH